MPNKLKKFFEFAQYDSIVEEVIHITETCLDGLDLLKIDDVYVDQDDRFGPCGVVEMHYDQEYLSENNLSGVYAVNDPTKLIDTIEIYIRFNNDVTSEQCVDLSDIEESIRELEDRLDGEGYDWQRRVPTYGEPDLIRYIIYLGKHFRSKGELISAISRSISENVRQSGDGSYSNFEGKDGQIMDFFHDLSDEFGLVYFPIPGRMNCSNKYLEEQSTNGCWYFSPNTNKLNIKIAFKESYIKENIREFVYYIEELENRLGDFTWESLCDNRAFGSKYVYKITHRIERIENSYRFSDDEISYLEDNKNMIPRIFQIDCFVEDKTAERIE